MYTETFSYLPQFSEKDIAKQVEYILRNNWIPGIEYTDDPGPHNSYWTFWKLPLFNARTVEEVLEEVNACKQENPTCYIKITGYDNKRQGQVLSFLAYRPTER